MYVPRVAKWNHTKICTEFLKDIDLSGYEFHNEFKYEYTNHEKQILNRISRRIQEEEDAETSIEEGDKSELE
ncbi:hypothetical protein MKW98_006034 [Papaver atlanticum]|uniref:Uncharacterized protein n=1 Tax=Papaver atlanticum TaxID=357466 RepID=A0AAD4XXC7_9MAGN|nr:hypothetical protein MKW98_006034 [Papaver atlanticum]